MRLDKKLQQQITIENYKNIFNDLIKSKTDKLTNEIRLAIVDGNDYENIEKNIDLFSKTFCNRASKGKYIFSPFREIQIPKAPYSKFEFKEAEKAGKLRTLAVSTINDTILQKMIYNTIYDYMEKKYSCIDSNIYGYRKGKSVKQAIEKIQAYFLQGYTYGIDGDLEKYFDKINAKLLGNWIYGKGYFVPCEHCGKPQKPQSWIGFFINTSDMRQLKLLDVWIRKQIRHFWFVRYGIRPERNYLRKPMLCSANEYYNCNVVSLFKEACYIKTYLKEHEDISFCECEHYEPIVIPYS